MACDVRDFFMERTKIVSKIFVNTPFSFRQSPTPSRLLLPSQSPPPPSRMLRCQRNTTNTPASEPPAPGHQPRLRHKPRSAPLHGLPNFSPFILPSSFTSARSPTLECRGDNPAFFIRNSTFWKTFPLFGNNSSPFFINSYFLIHHIFKHKYTFWKTFCLTKHY